MGWAIGLFNFLCLLWASCCSAAHYSEAFTQPNFTNCIFVVDIRGIAAERQLAASVAVGLLNRQYDRPTAIVLNSPNDWKWVAGMRSGSELSGSRWVAASDADIIAYAVSVGAVRATIGYTPAEPWSLANVVTMAGIQWAVPVPTKSKPGDLELRLTPPSPTVHATPMLVEIDGVPPRSSDGVEWEALELTLGLNALGGNASELPSDPYVGTTAVNMAVDVSGNWADELEATLWAWAHLYSSCLQTDEFIAIQRPEVLSRGFLADFTVSQQMFVFFLPKMCSPGPQQLLFRAFAEQAFAAGKQLKVMGYSIENEVVADCSIHHTEVSLVSDWCPNLSFYSLMDPVLSQLQQIPLLPAPVFNPNHTYVAIINSDGDNLQMENNGNRNGMDERVQLCAQAGSSCPPLGWTMSNQLVKYSPFQLRWYFSKAQETGRDTFLMGPSGFGFLHPAAISSGSPLLTHFISGTIKAAEQLSMTGYVHWDIDANGLPQRRSTAYLGLGEFLEYNQSAFASQTVDLESSEAALQHRRSLSTAARVSQEQPTGQGRSAAADVLQNQLGMDSRKRAAAHPGQSEREEKKRPFGANSNSVAREAYIRRYDGTQINTVFAPGEYGIPLWLGNVAAIPEQYRWDTGMSTVEAVKRTNNLPRGTVGYIYKIWDVQMKELEQFGKSVAPHVHIVDHRQLHDIALQRKFGQAA